MNAKTDWIHKLPPLRLRFKGSTESSLPAGTRVFLTFTLCMYIYGGFSALFEAHLAPIPGHMAWRE